jgi:hypothetical protein
MPLPPVQPFIPSPVTVTEPVSLRRTKSDTIRAEHAARPRPGRCARRHPGRNATGSADSLTAFVKRDAKGRRIHEGAEQRTPTDLTAVRKILAAVNLDHHLPLGNPAPDDVAAIIEGGVASY